MATKAGVVAFVWASVSTRLLHMQYILNTEQPVFIPNMPKVNNKTEMDQLNITENTILSILKELNIGKSPGPNEISTRRLIIIELSDVIFHPLCKIFETSLRQICIPDDWKDAKILAIYKNDNQNCLQLPSNKSNKHSLQMHGKIKRNRITSYMKENGMFSPKHYGFIYGRSTVLQLIIILDMK